MVNTYKSQPIKYMYKYLMNLLLKLCAVNLGIYPNISISNLNLIYIVKLQMYLLFNLMKSFHIYIIKVYLNL